MKHKQYIFFTTDISFQTAVLVRSSHKFPSEPDYTLSLHNSDQTVPAHYHLVSEPSPYSDHNELRSLAADHPILMLFTIPEFYLSAIVMFPKQFST